MDKYKFFTILIALSLLLFCCKDDDSTSILPLSRSFNMGFTTWSFGPNLVDVNETYQFIESHSDMYTEHIDNKIPWNAWINDTPLPSEFTNEIIGKANRRINNMPLLLSVSLLNLNRDELAEDFDGSIPNYSNLNDSDIENAYVKHVSYLIDQFSPEYVVIAIEFNELRLRAESKWDGYVTLIQNVKVRIKQLYPDIEISESVSLHNLYNPDIPNASEYIEDVVNHMNQLDFVAISFYPFLKNLHTQTEFQNVFDFLHANVNKPIAFVETSHIAENLIVPNLDVSINGNQNEQNLYVQTLFENARQHNYKFLIWWAHRDYDALWDTFPEELKDIGQLWRDSGLLDENGNQRLSKSTWDFYLAK